MSGSSFRGTSLEQDGRFGKAEEKLIAKLSKAGKFSAILDTKVNLKKVNLDVISKWISAKIIQLVGFEDDILINLVINMLEGGDVDPKKMQLDVTGFLEKQSQSFVEELWTLLVDAQNQSSGIPSIFIEKKKEEILNREAAQRHIIANLPSISQQTTDRSLQEDSKPLPSRPAAADERSRGRREDSRDRGRNDSDRNRDGRDSRRRSRSRSPEDRRDDRSDRHRSSHHSSRRSRDRRSRDRDDRRRGDEDESRSSRHHSRRDSDEDRDRDRERRYRSSRGDGEDDDREHRHRHHHRTSRRHDEGDKGVKSVDAEELTRKRDREGGEERLAVEKVPRADNRPRSGSQSSSSSSSEDSFVKL